MNNNGDETLPVVPSSVLDLSERNSDEDFEYLQFSDYVARSILSFVYDPTVSSNPALLHDVSETISMFEWTEWVNYPELKTAEEIREHILSFMLRLTNIDSNKDTPILQHMRSQLETAIELLTECNGNIPHKLKNQSGSKIAMHTVDAIRTLKHTISNMTETRIQAAGQSILGASDDIQEGETSKIEEYHFDSKEEFFVFVDKHINAPIRAIEDEFLQDVGTTFSEHRDLIRKGQLPASLEEVYWKKFVTADLSMIHVYLQGLIKLNNKLGIY